MCRSGRASDRVGINGFSALPAESNLHSADRRSKPGLSIVLNQEPNPEQYEVKASLKACGVDLAFQSIHAELNSNEPKIKVGVAEEVAVAI